MLALFDSPVIVTNCSVRSTSTIPLAVAGTVEFRVRPRARAKTFATRLEREEGGDTGRRIELAFQTTVGRPPDAVEKSAAERFLTEQAAFYDHESGNTASDAPKASQQNLEPGSTAGAQRAWQDFCQMLFAGNAFLYVD